jgi:hypothetical protein
MSESAFRDGISAVEFAQGGGWIRHAQSRSAYPAMFEARDVPGGVDRTGMVCLAITVLRGADLSPRPLSLSPQPPRVAGSNVRRARCPQALPKNGL